MSDDEHSSYPRASSSKRYTHNYLERNRRNNFKESFERLKNELPCFQGNRGGRRNPSRLEVLKRTSKFIKYCQRGPPALKEIDKMKAQKEELQEMIAAITAATASGDLAAAAPFVDKYLAAERVEPMPPPPEDEDDDEQLEGGEEEDEDDDEQLEGGEEEDEETTDSDDSEENDSYRAGFR